MVLVLLLNTGLLASSTISGWIMHYRSMTVGDLDRSYTMMLPASGTAASMPVVIVLHGCCTTPLVEIERSGFTSVAGKSVLVYPSGYSERWNAGDCCGYTSADDVTFISDVVAGVLSEVPQADPSRVYLVGYSNGGRMAYRLACEVPQLFAAVGIFAALPVQECTNPAPVKILVAASEDDDNAWPVVQENILSPTVRGEVAFYRRVNGCAEDGTACASGKTATLVLYPGANHTWPPDLPGIMWSFFTGTTFTGTTSGPPDVSTLADDLDVGNEAAVPGG